ncbi:unnamed protein product [Didymodactylos carnosus]|uniref:Extradiol ring-cleavage dioxygenase class III enzyme subunit B domain-containing protein n=1 Tax=Didymodactylos carnosus TaxID=1234261 RepID=A0A814VQE8_9BILA|nr:unnamed protein product [Didymodactylos carnosus]CAF1256976.1 unnamed protein product [Didymodactylos carnosus]CAF3958553.1 unnamed protein product [Didymodactylos carnosus]CAF4063834.1 unnamed protein product [Didymodactylos carnosus]
MSSSKQPAMYVTHGGGPCWFMDGKDFPSFANIDKNSAGAKWFRQLPHQIGQSDQHKPKAILLVSAHWESSDVVHISAQAQHTDLYYDYGGFPKETYEIKFQPKGDLQLSQQVLDLLKKSNISAVLNSKRNFDHGVFIPLKLMYPNANIPVVSMSILDTYSPEQHVAIGKALSPLREQGVLIIGSGSITHGRASREQINEFVDAITNTLQTLSPNEREETMINWTRLPYARENHGREDHLIPLHVVVGAAGQDKCELLNPHLSKSLAAYKFA